MPKISPKQKKFLLAMLNKRHFLAGLDSMFADGEEKDFQEVYQVSFKEAEQAVEYLREKLRAEWK